MHDRLTISVRALVEFIMRGGSIDNRISGYDPDRAVEGIQIHKKLQKALSAGVIYEPEVTLSLEYDFGAYVLHIDGRADGVITDSDGIMIDEIKSTSAPMDIIGEDFNETHWAQAGCYAYMYCASHSLDTVRTRLTYYQVETGEIRQYIRKYEFIELEKFFTELMDKYKRWSDLRYTWETERDLSIKALGFPFNEYRQGQRKMAASVYKTIYGSGKLFCQAPTGIGKTISALFPSVKAVGEGIAERIFYLTAKTITRQAAEGALKGISKNLP